ncbi:hypothetical protein HPB48_023503 [Haemaphysalis longicornis]|uniref:Uncharacterized protein n=1 Tax=Haemaphysalis longicornis TaxID=44386 RepID=A0A9J6H599_HAELO|nr:hypothetical protein HPB48_023503 [Haemaphysalis longicornis]
MKARFGDSIAKKKPAQQRLLQRAQIPGETCATYIAEVWKICRIVKSQKSDENKVGHLLKDIAKDAYNFLIRRDNLNTPSDAIRHCQHGETLKTRSIARRFGILQNVPTVSTCDYDGQADVAHTIRRIVREGLSSLRDTTCRGSSLYTRDVHHKYQ